MAGGKESPRQKMIGMMYLVLLAMLALNVSKDILEAFVVINDSLESTTAGMEEKSVSTMQQFQQQLALDQQKVAPFFTKANKVKQHADSTVAYLDQVKKQLIAFTEGFQEPMPDSMYSLQKVKGKDNYDKPTELLIGSEPALPIETEISAKTIKKNLIDYTGELTALFDAEKDNSVIAELKNAINLAPIATPDGSTESWETGNFYHVPLAAVITTLSKLQNDVRNAEGFALRTLFSQINQQDFKFDKIEAKVVPVSNYVLRGEPFKAEVFLAAYSTTEQPQMFVGNYDSTADVFTAKDSLSVAEGLGALQIDNTSIGLKNYDGVIKLRKPDGTLEDYHFKGEYMVAEPSVTVSATRMNVLYRGLENPIDVSVPGVPSENLRVSISGGNSLTRGNNGEYQAKISPQSPATVNVSVTAKMPDGSETNMGQREFRIKYLPTPFAAIGNIKTQGAMTVSELIANQGIKASYGEDFNYPLRPLVGSFKVNVRVNGKSVDLESDQNTFTEDMTAAFRGMRSGSTLSFFDINYQGKDGRRVDLNPIIIKLR
jgi:gliding motility-associated protein GldM